MKSSSQKGFSLVEVMIAMVVLAVGLTGVAAMQLTAIRGNTLAWNMNTGSNQAQQWMEWIIHNTTRANQDTVTYWSAPGVQKLQKENFVALANLDADQFDDGYTQVELPAAQSKTQFLLMAGTQAVLSHFKNSDGDSFTVNQIPDPPGKGYRMFWRITANRPVEDTATVEIETRVTNAFARSKTRIIRFIVTPNL